MHIPFAPSLYRYAFPPPLLSLPNKRVFDLHVKHMNSAWEYETGIKNVIIYVGRSMTFSCERGENRNSLFSIAHGISCSECTVRQVQEEGRDSGVFCLWGFRKTTQWIAP